MDGVETGGLGGSGLARAGTGVVGGVVKGLLRGECLADVEGNGAVGVESGRLAGTGPAGAEAGAVVAAVA